MADDQQKTQKKKKKKRGPDNDKQLPMLNHRKFSFVMLCTGEWYETASF